jgi:arylsulfatase A-like enzyme
MENELIVEQPTQLQSLTRRYADRAIQFLEEQTESGNAEPFFLMVSFQHAHEPQFISPEFNHRAPAGPHQDYSDSMLELDYHVGRVLDFVRSSQQEGRLTDDLIVMLASDNGPSLISQQYGGSPGSLRCGKSTTWEGGHRVPSIVWGPRASVPQGVITSEMVSNLDWLPTILSLAGIEPPVGVPLDGVDVSSMLLGKTTTSPRDTMFFYGRQGTLNAVRHGKYKLHYYTSGWGSSPEELCGPKDYVQHDPPLLFDLEKDIFEGESIPADSLEYKLASRKINELVEQHNSTMTVGEFTLTEDENAMPWPPEPFEPWVQSYDGPLCVDVPSPSSRPWRKAGLAQQDSIDRLTWYEMGTAVHSMEL